MEKSVHSSKRSPEVKRVGNGEQQSNNSTDRSDQCGSGWLLLVESGMMMTAPRV